jgi:hypothetical protein
MTDNPIDSHTSPDVVEFDSESIENDSQLKNQGKTRTFQLDFNNSEQRNKSKIEKKSKKHMKQEMLQPIVKRSLKF